RVRISGRIDVCAVRTALDGVAQGHPMLRTAIHSDGGRNPRFVPARCAPIPLRLVDKGSWQTEIDRELRERFEPDAPLLRATLIPVEPDVHASVLPSPYPTPDSAPMASWARQVLERAAGGVPDWAPEFPAPSGSEDLVPAAFRGLSGTARGLARL